MASKDVEGHLDRESSGAYKIVKAGRFWILRTKGRTKRISFLDNASEVSITENILVADDNIFEIDEDENGQISFQRVEDVSYNSKDVETYSKDKVQNIKYLKTKSEYQESSASSFDDPRNVTESAVPFYEETKEYLRIASLTLNDNNRNAENGNGKDTNKENEILHKTDAERTSVSIEDFLDRDGELERGHEEYISLDRSSTEVDSTIEINRKQSAPRKLEDADDLLGLRLDPLTGRHLNKTNSKPSVQHALKQLHQTFEPLSYQDENGAYIYLLCGTDDQSIVLSSDDMFESRADAIVISVDSKGRAGSTASNLRSKMPRLVFLEYMREVDVHLKNMKLGDVFLTNGYTSGYRYIIHVISQMSERIKPTSERQLDLRKMYGNIFEVCQGQTEIQSVAMTLSGIDTGSKEEVKMGSGELLNAYINCFVKSGPRLEPMSVHFKCRREITFNTVKDVFDFYVTRKKGGHGNASQRYTYAGDTETKVQYDIRYDLFCHNCMEIVVNKQALECGHVFCYKCFKQHYTVTRTCPICRMIPGEAAVECGEIIPKTEEKIKLKSEKVWEVISTRHSEELGKLKANFDEFRYNSGTVFVTATGRSDVTENLLKEFRQFINRFKNKEYCEMSVDAAKDVMTWCNDTERDIGYECCFYEPGTQKVMVYSDSYEDCLKIRHLFRLKSGMMRPTARRRKRTENYLRIT